VVHIVRALAVVSLLLLGVSVVLGVSGACVGCVPGVRGAAPPASIALLAALAVAYATGLAAISLAGMAHRWAWAVMLGACTALGMSGLPAVAVVAARLPQIATNLAPHAMLGVLALAVLAPLAALGFSARWGWNLGTRIGTHVLVVEEDPRARARLSAMLAAAGYRVVAAADETAALGVLRRSPHPLVVVLDAHHAHLLDDVLVDRRASSHHAYVILSAETRAAVTAPAVSPSALARLIVVVVRDRRQRSTLLRAVNRAARGLPPDPLYPVAALRRRLPARFR
jgi:CheY-like chemotaxis protein